MKSRSLPVDDKVNELRTVIMEACHGMRCHGAQGGVDGLDALVCVEHQFDV